MTLTEKQFEKYLMLYGTDLDQWPEALLAEAICTPFAEELIIKQQYVDEILLANDLVPSPSPDLAERILRKSRAIKRKATFSIMDWISAIFADFSLPQPAYVLTAVVLLGLSVGVSNADMYGDSGIFEQASIDDGAAL